LPTHSALVPSSFKYWSCWVNKKKT
jgi:hypothetical protein